jgi:hypothetical protein
MQYPSGKIFLNRRYSLPIQLRYGMCFHPMEMVIHNNLPAAATKKPPARGKRMGFNINRAREVHFNRLQKALEEGLQGIESAASPVEADAARLRAQARMEELNQMWDDAFPKEEE